MKNTMRKAMLSTIAMLVVAVMSLTGVTYAWFTAGEQATVNGMTAVVTAADGGVQVRLEGEATWQTELNLNINADNAGKINPVSSVDGEAFFVLGDKNPADANQAKVVEVTDNDVDADNEDDIIVRRIELSNPGQSPVTVDLDGSSIVRSATAGVSNDIYKAVRVALIVSGAGNDTTYIYAAQEDTWYGFVAESDSYVTLSTSSDVATQTTTDAVEDCTINLPANPDNADSDKIVDVEIVIWVEGQDTDCKNANAAGAFDIVLNFKDVDAE